jgi:exosortase H (IPTLxxWG-CTERM-specific)
MGLDTKKKAMLRFILAFFALVVGLTLFIQIPLVDRYIVLPYVQGITVLSGWIYGLFDSTVETSRTFMSQGGFSVNIKRGCDGIVATIILVSACIAFPSTWKMKFKGIVQGYLLIFILNLFRILVLFALGVNGQIRLFNLVHTYVAQFIVIACVMVFWIYWAGKTRADPPR